MPRLKEGGPIYSIEVGRFTVSKSVASIAARWQPGDHIYASGAGLPPLMYYGTIFHPGSHLSFVSPREPAYTPREEAPYVPLPAHEGRLWFIWFVYPMRWATTGRF